MNLRDLSGNTYKNNPFHPDKRREIPDISEASREDFIKMEDLSPIFAENNIYVLPEYENRVTYYMHHQLK